jgi:hypothetical protein
MTYEVNIYIGIAPDSIPHEIPDNLPDLGENHNWYGVAIEMDQDDYIRIFPNGENAEGIKQLLKEAIKDI